VCKQASCSLVNSSLEISYEEDHGFIASRKAKRSLDEMSDYQVLQEGIFRGQLFNENSRITIGGVIIFAI